MALVWKYMAGEAVNNEDNEGLSANWATETVNVRTGGQAYRGILTGSGTTRILTSLAGTGGGAAQLLADDHSGAIWAIRFSDVTPAKNIKILNGIASGGGGGGATPGAIRFKINGDLALLDTNATPNEIATASPGFVVDTYYVLRTLWEVVGSDIRVRLHVWNGRQWVGLIDHTVAGAAHLGMRYDFHASTATGDNASTNVYIDDIAVFTFTAESDLPTTPVKVLRMTPNALGTFGDFTGGTGTSPAFEDVDDANSDEEITLDSSTAVAGTQNQTYNLTSFTTPAGVRDIEAIEVFVNAQIDTALAPDRNILIHEQSTSNIAPSFMPTGAAYQTAGWLLSAPPSGGALWTDAILASLEAGVRKAGVPIVVINLSQVLVDVLYLEPFLSERWHLRGVGRGILRGVR